MRMNGLGRIPLLVMLIVAAAHAQATLKINVKETSFGKLPPGARGDMMVYSADGAHAAFPVRERTGWHVIRDGVKQKEFEWIQPATLLFSDDGSKLGFFIQKGDNQAVVINDEQGKEFAEVRSLVFNKDGSRWAYVAKLTGDSDGYVVVVDGTPTTEYAKILPASPVFSSVVFSPDGKRLAFAYEKKGKETWVLDGKEIGPFDRVGPMTFSPDSTRYAFTAERDGKQFVILDGQPGKTYDRVRAIVFSPDSKRLAFSAGRSRDYFTVVDDVEGKAFDLVGDCLFSPDSKRVVHEAFRGKRRLLVEVGAGDEPQTHDYVRSPVFSKDSRTLAYVAVEEKKWVVFIDGKRQEKEYDLIGVLALSPDGKRHAYAARINSDAGKKDLAVVDGKEVTGAGRISFSPDGKYVAHTADGTADLKASEDSIERSAHSYLWINETRGPAVTGFLVGSQWVWTAPNKLLVMAGRKGEIFRMEIEIQE